MARVLTASAIGSEIVRRQKAFTKEDFIKTKFLFRVLFLVAFMAILSLFYIWSRIQIVQYGYEINTLRKRHHELIEGNKRLKMEVATLKAPQRIESIAKNKLKMQSPKPEQIKEIP